MTPSEKLVSDEYSEAVAFLRCADDRVRAAFMRVPLAYLSEAGLVSHAILADALSPDRSKEG